MWRATNWYWVFASVSTRSRYWVIISVSTCGIYQGHSYCISQTGLEAMPDLRKRGCVMVLLCWEHEKVLIINILTATKDYCGHGLLSFPAPILIPLSPFPFPILLPSSLFLPFLFLYHRKHWVGIGITLNIHPFIYQSQHPSSANHQDDPICNLPELKPEFLELSKKHQK